MNFTSRFHLVAVGLLVPLTASLAQFNPGPNPIAGSVGNQSISSGMGTVSATGTITIGGGTTALSILGGTSSIINNGSILQTGTGRTIDNTGGGNDASISITNNASGLIQSASGDTIRVNRAASNVTLTNSGEILSLNPGGGGSQALDFDAVTTGTVIIENKLGGLIRANAADAIRTGANAMVTNAGTILAIPIEDSGDPPNVTGSDGIDAQSRSGVQITNTGSISGRHGITGGTDTNFAITINNNSGSITGVNGSGINIDGLSSTSGATVNNAFGAQILGQVLASTVDGDGDGVDVDGTLTLDNAGDIFGFGAKGLGSDGGQNNAEAVATGGGSIINRASGQIIGSTLAADAPNGDSTRLGNGILVDDSNGGGAYSATSITNSGLIQGKSGFGIKIIGGFADTITNNATGTIRGAITGQSVIQTGSGNDAVTHAGSVIHDGGISETAIALEGDDDLLIITGDGAVVIGGMDGGDGNDTLRFDLGSNSNSFSYDGIISNFEAVNILSGVVTFNEGATYSGTTMLEGGTFLLDGMQMGNGSLTAQSGATLGGAGSIAGSLNLEAGAKFVFSLTETLTVNGSNVDFGGFSIADLVGLDGSVANGTYLLIDGAATFNYENVNDLGFANAVSIGDGKSAFFEEGSLRVTIVPEPGTALLFSVGAGWLLMARRRKS